MSGAAIDYAKLVDGSPTDDVVLCGSPSIVDGLRSMVVRR
jgi:hypothetical protein